MARIDFTGIHCSIARTFGVFEDGWSALIVRDLHAGIRRFDVLLDDLGISRKVLTERLHALVEIGVVRRSEYQANPVRSEYLLTEAGEDLVPAVLALMAWGDRWMAGDEGAPAVLRHRTGGGSHACRPAVVCAECGEELSAASVTARPGPGGRSAAGTRRIGAVLHGGPS